MVVQEAFTVIRLRQTEPNLHRPYRAWGYPWTPLLFIAATLAFTVNLWFEEPVRSSLGVLVISPAHRARGGCPRAIEHPSNRVHQQGRAGVFATNMPGGTAIGV